MKMTNEELALAIQRDGDPHGEYMLALIRQNENFTHQVARPFLASGCIENAELTSISFFAHTANVSYFRSEIGAYLTTFRPILITELLRNARLTSSVVLSWGERAWFRKYKIAVRDFMQANDGKMPSDTWLCRKLNIDKAQLALLRVVEKMLSPVYLDSIVKKDGERLALADVIADSSSLSLEEQEINALFVNELREAITSIMDEHLTPNQRKIVWLHFSEAMSLPEIAEMTKESVEAVRRDYNKAMRVLKNPQSTLRLSRFWSNTNFYSGAGLESFQHSWSGQPEKLAITHLDGERGPSHEDTTGRI